MGPANAAMYRFLWFTMLSKRQKVVVTGVLRANRREVVKGGCGCCSHSPLSCCVLGAKHPWPKPHDVHGLLRFGKGRASMAKT